MEQGLAKAVLPMSVYGRRLSFECYILWQTIKKLFYDASRCKEALQAQQLVRDRAHVRVQEEKPRFKLPSKLIYFECKFEANLLFYVLKLNFTKIEF